MAIAGGATLTIVTVSIILRAIDEMLALLISEMHLTTIAPNSASWEVITGITDERCRGPYLHGSPIALASIGGKATPLHFATLHGERLGILIIHLNVNLPMTTFKFALNPVKEAGSRRLGREITSRNFAVMTRGICTAAKLQW